jgi:hypothetical protein
MQYKKIANFALRNRGRSRYNPPHRSAKRWQARRHVRMDFFLYSGQAVTIDPFGWLVTLPMAIGLYWVYLQPATHPLKEMWRASMEREDLGWLRLGVENGRGAADERRSSLLLFWSVTGALLGVSALSLGSYLGLI